MLPHPETAIAVLEFDYQELLRAAAKERLAASAQCYTPSRIARLRKALLAATSWLGKRRRRKASVQQGRSAPSLAWD